VNKHRIDEEPIKNIERSPALLLSAVIISAGLCLLTWWLFKQVSPFGFLFMVPAVVLTLQTGWMLMNPFALIFERRLEIKQSWFQHTDRYFNDLDKVSANKKGEIFITYTDGEVEKLNVFGIRSKDKSALVESCDKQIRHTLTTRV
jgi:hypothetical protein